MRRSNFTRFNPWGKMPARDPTAPPRLVRDARAPLTFHPEDDSIMPMELYSSEAFVRDIVNAISRSEGKPLNIGGNDQHGIERDYAFLLISQAKRAVEGNAGSEGSKPAGKAPA